MVQFLIQHGLYQQPIVYLTDYDVHGKKSNGSLLSKQK